MCSSLTNISFQEPSNLTEIGFCGFGECEELKSISIPSSIKTIESGAFQKCLNLESVSFQEPSNLRKIGEQSFSNCINLKTIELPSQVKEIASYSFEGCTKLESLIILSNISEIKDSAFLNCSNLGCISYYEIKEPDVSQDAFQGCNN